PAGQQDRARNEEEQERDVQRQEPSIAAQVLDDEPDCRPGRQQLVVPVTLLGMEEEKGIAEAQPEEGHVAAEAGWDSRQRHNNLAPTAGGPRQSPASLAR